MDKLKQKIPAMFEGLEVVPSLLHGDLWSGNFDETDDYPGTCTVCVCVCVCVCVFVYLIIISPPFRVGSVTRVLMIYFQRFYDFLKT